MANIVDDQDQNANDNNSLNQPSEAASSAPTNATPTKAASSGQYTNFNNYMQANKNTGQRLSNVLGSNVQQQGQAVQNTADTSKNVTTAIGAENQRISTDLDKIRGAVQQGQGGDYSGFNQFLNYGTQASGLGAAPSNIQTAAGPSQDLTQNMAYTGPSQLTGAYTTAQPDPTNPINARLNDNIQQLINGQTQGAQLGQQANDIFNVGQNQLANVQTNQALGQTEGGRQQLLQNILGHKGTYGQGSNVLDQALISGNTGRLNNLLGTLNTTTQNAQNALGTAQTDVATGLQGLEQNAMAAKGQLPGLSQQGLGSLDTLLGQQATTAEQQRQQQQLDILNQLNTQNFKQDTANQLGIGDQTTLFNVLKDNGQNYGITDKANLGQFANTPYLNLNQAQVNKANTINNPQLQAYATMQKIMGNSPEAMAYKQVGTVDPAYNLNSQQFDKDLAAKYQAAADAASKDVVGGSGAQEYGHGLFNSTRDTARANVSRGVNELIDPNAIRAAANNFSAMNQPATDVTGNLKTGATPWTSDVSGNIQNLPGNLLAGGVKGAASGALFGGGVGAIPGAVIGAAGQLVPLVGSVINNISDALGNNNNASTSQQNANDQAKANFLANWQNYLKSRGYTDVAHVGQQDMEKNKNFNVG